jgi:hypothetical protein
MDNSLKDFLLSANKKFNPTNTDKELNILSVSCNDAEDMQLWYYYMFKDQGLFTSASFHPTAEFENVDVVILNNLYYKHNEYFNKKLLNSWDFGNCFNLIFINPFAKQKKEEAINELLRICPNQNAGFRAFPYGSGFPLQSFAKSKRISASIPNAKRSGVRSSRI